MAEIVDLKEATLSNGVVIELIRINTNSFQFDGEEMKVEGVEYAETDASFLSSKRYSGKSIKFNGYYYAFKPKK